MLFACTCAADPSTPHERVPAGLRSLTAGCGAQQLTRELAREDEAVQGVVNARLERWLIHGARLDVLAGVLVHERTPPRFA